MTAVPRCSTCAEFTARYIKAQSDKERQALQDAQDLHLSQMQADRKIDKRLSTLSEVCTAPGSQIDGPESVYELGTSR